MKFKKINVDKDIAVAAQKARKKQEKLGGLYKEIRKEENIEFKFQGHPIQGVWRDDKLLILSSSDSERKALIEMRPGGVLCWTLTKEYADVESDERNGNIRPENRYNAAFEKDDLGGAIQFGLVELMFADCSKVLDKNEETEWDDWFNDYFVAEEHYRRNWTLFVPFKQNLAFNIPLSGGPFDSDFGQVVKLRFPFTDIKKMEDVEWRQILDDGVCCNTSIAFRFWGDDKDVVVSTHNKLLEVDRKTLKPLCFLPKLIKKGTASELAEKSDYKISLLGHFLSREIEGFRDQKGVSRNWEFSPVWLSEKENKKECWIETPENSNCLLGKPEGIERYQKAVAGVLYSQKTKDLLDI
jgi:hypothetical protein